MTTESRPDGLMTSFTLSLGKTMERNPSYSFSCRQGCAVIASENEKMNTLIVCLEALGNAETLSAPSFYLRT
jgi:hypothetical protein